MKKRTLTTITGGTLTVTPNLSKKTFTLKKSSGSKYRTLPMTSEDFASAKSWTGNDWSQFLKNTEEYYPI
jgi:hypothetical protein